MAWASTSEEQQQPTPNPIQLRTILTDPDQGLLPGAWPRW